MTTWLICIVALTSRILAVGCSAAALIFALKAWRAVTRGRCPKHSGNALVGTAHKKLGTPL